MPEDEGYLLEVESLAGLDLLRFVAQELGGASAAPVAAERRDVQMPGDRVEEARSLARTIERSLRGRVNDGSDLDQLAGILVTTAMVVDATTDGFRPSLIALLAGYFRYEGRHWVQWGRLDAFTHFAWVDRGPTPLLFRLITIAGEKCGIERENHGSWGYHYHYLDHKRRRSDVIFSFSPAETKTPPRLWWERHGEGKAAVTANVEAWGDSKRTSIHDACERDLTKRKLADYKRPSKEARVLWPIP